MSAIKTKSVRYGAIDGLRALSAIGIIMMHVLANGGYEINGYVFNKIIPSFADLVFLFMVISGFSMCCGYYEKIITNTISFESFYKKRFAKILPFFAVLNVLDIIVSPSLNSVYEVFANLTLCFGFLPNGGEISVIGVGWFLGLVFVFYIIFPFYCFLLSNKRRTFITFIIAYIFNILCIVRFGAFRNNIVYSFVFFVAGGIIYLYKDNISRNVKKFRLPVVFICLAAAAAYYIIGSYVIIMLVLFSFLLIYAIGPYNTPVLCNPAAKFISSISMEIYLCHMVVYRAIEKIGIIHLFKSQLLSYIFVVLGTIAGSFVFAFFGQLTMNKIAVSIKRISGRRK